MAEQTPEARARDLVATQIGQLTLSLAEAQAHVEMLLSEVKAQREQLAQAETAAAQQTAQIASLQERVTTLMANQPNSPNASLGG